MADYVHHPKKRREGEREALNSDQPCEEKGNEEEEEEEEEEAAQKFFFPFSTHRESQMLVRLRLRPPANRGLKASHPPMDGHTCCFCSAWGSFWIFLSHSLALRFAPRPHSNKQRRHRTLQHAFHRLLFPPFHPPAEQSLFSSPSPSSFLVRESGKQVSFSIHVSLTGV